jgi:hypothetical protein
LPKRQRRNTANVVVNTGSGHFERRRLMQIKFSHSYPKLNSQKQAKLLAVEIYKRSDFSESFIVYDTMYLAPSGNFDLVEKFYPLPPAKYMVLVFLGNDLIPFTTVRRWTEEKFRYYSSSIGSIFDIVIVAAEKQGAEPVQPTTRKVPH